MLTCHCWSLGGDRPSSSFALVNVLICSPPGWCFNLFPGRPCTVQSPACCHQIPSQLFTFPGRDKLQASLPDHEAFPLDEGWLSLICVCRCGHFLSPGFLLCFWNIRLAAQWVSYSSGRWGYPNYVFILTLAFFQRAGLGPVGDNSISVKVTSSW